MRAVQVQQQILIDTTKPTDSHPLTANGKIASENPELQPLARHRRSDFAGPAQQHLRRLQRLLAEHDERVGVDDAGLLRRHRVEGGTKFLMIKRDRSHHRHGRVQHVGRVPGPAHADLDDTDIDRRVGESGESHRGQQLEEGDTFGMLAVDKLNVGDDVVVRLGEGGSRSGSTSQTDTFSDALQVRGRVTAGSDSEGAQQRIHHAGCGGLAVGPRQMDRGVGPLGLAQQVDQVPHAFQIGQHPMRESVRPAPCSPG